VHRQNVILSRSRSCYKIILTPRKAQLCNLQLSAGRRGGTGHERVVVDVAAPAGTPVDLLVEGPTTDWALVHYRPFDFSLLNNRRSIRRSHRDWNCTSFTCSSLIAAAYQHIGVMARPPEGPLPNNVLPSDFSEDGTLTLTSGYSLDHEVILKKSDDLDW
jgi:hypothetical protein